MLAGDAMQALAFEVLTPEQGVAPALQARLCALLARAAGHAGMAGGQAIDLASIGKPLDETRAARHAPPQDRRAAAGQRADGRGLRRVDAAAAWDALADYGAAVGLAFQVVDDILDVTQESDTLGKTAGKDQWTANKPTYVSVLGLRRGARRGARDHAQELRRSGRPSHAGRWRTQRTADGAL